MSPSLPWNPSKREGDGSAELTVPARAVPAAAPSEPATTATGLVAVHARLRRRSWRCSRRRLRSSRRSSARSVATGTRPEWSVACGPRFSVAALGGGDLQCRPHPERDPSDRRAHPCPRRQAERQRRQGLELPFRRSCGGGRPVAAAPSAVVSADVSWHHRQAAANPPAPAPVAAKEAGRDRVRGGRGPGSLRARTPSRRSRQTLSGRR